MPTVKAKDGTELFYRDWGSGTPVVMVHGWPLDADMWEYQAVPLAEAGLRVIAYDRRGFGRSDQPWTGYDYDTLADDLAAVIEQLDLHGAVLVGFSMGGGEVARYLSRHGAGRVAKAVLVSCVTPFLLKTPDHPDGLERDVFEQMADALRQDRPAFLASFGRQFFGAGMLNFTVTEGILEWAREMALRGSPKATIDCLHAFASTDFRGDMKAFTVPTLVIHGDHDATVPADATGRAAAAAIPGAELLIYPGAPHALFFTEKARLTADLLEFIGD